MPSIEKAIIVGLVNQKQDSLQTQEFLDELAFLALTSGAKVVNRFTQRLNQPLPNTFIGKGKLGVIKDFVKEHHIDLVIFDDDLTDVYNSRTFCLFEDIELIKKKDLQKVEVYKMQ